MLFSALSVESLDRILHFGGSNDVFCLLLTGDALLIHKIKRTGTLAISWSSSAYFDFNACLPLIHSFTDLQSLRLTTWSQQLLPLTRLNTSMFPPNLKSLELSFYDVFGILASTHCMKIFAGLHFLESLSMHSTSAPYYARNITLVGFPQSLRVLRLSAGQNVTVAHSSSDMRDLPTNLEMLELQVRPRDHNGGGIVLVPGAFAGHLTSLTSLSLKLNDSVMLDTKFIGHRLRHLEVLDGEVVHDRVHALQNGDALDIIYPELLSLKVDCCSIASWFQLPTLPPNLTWLAVPLESLGSDWTASSQSLEYLNQAHVDGTFKISNLRGFENSGRGKLGYRPHLLHHFSNLLETRCTTTSLGPDLELLPTSLTNLTLDKAKVSWLSHLQASLTKLTIEELLYEAEEESSWRANEGRKALSRLSFLSVEQGFSASLVPLLPTTLTCLHVGCHDNGILRAIALRPLPLLKTYHVRMTVRPTYVVERTNDLLGDVLLLQALELSLDTIPPSVTSLTAKGIAALSIDPPSRCLRHHRSLTSLKVAESEVEPDDLHHLPPQLRVLDVILSRAINIADPEDTLNFYHLREKLPELRSLSMLEPSIRDKERAISTLRNPFRYKPYWKLLRAWMSLPSSLKLIYLKSIDGALSQRLSTPNTIADLVLYSCLPRKLAIVGLPQSRFRETAKDRLPGFLAPLRLYVAGTLKYFVPLLGLVLFDETDYRLELPYQSDSGRIDALPPHLSYDASANPTLIHAARTGFLFPELYNDNKSTTPWVSTSETVYHLLTLISWLTAAVVEPNTWRQPGLLRYLMLSGLLGSAVCLPIAAWRWNKSRKHPRNGYSDYTAIPWFWRLVGCVNIIGAPLALSFGLAQSEKPAYMQWFALVCGIYTSGISHHFTYLTRK